MNSYTIERDRDHYAVLKDGVFYCSADSRAEANNEIAIATAGCATCDHEFQSDFCWFCKRNINNYRFPSFPDNWYKEEARND